MSLFPARMKKIQSKMKALKSVHNFSAVVSLWGFFSRAQGQQTPQCSQMRLNFELGPVYMAVLLTCKNEEDLIKNEGARVFTTLYIDFSDAQGQLTP